MQRKFKSVFHRSSKKQAPTDEAGHHLETTSPRSVPVDRRGASSLDEQRSQHSGGSRVASHRPLSSIYDSSRLSKVSLEPAIEAFSSDYKTYLSALSRANDYDDEQHNTLGGDRRLIVGESEGRHEEDVADRNIERYRTSIDASKRKPLPETAGMCLDRTSVLSRAGSLLWSITMLMALQMSMW